MLTRYMHFYASHFNVSRTLLNRKSMGEGLEHQRWVIVRVRSIRGGGLSMLAHSEVGDCPACHISRWVIVRVGKFCWWGNVRVGNCPPTKPPHDYAF